MILYFENEACSAFCHTLVLREIRQIYPEEYLIMISAGDFSAEGVLTETAEKTRAAEYIKEAADLVLSLPTASILGGYGKKEFAMAALAQRLRMSDHLLLPCTPLPGQSLKDCEKSLRALAMSMFKEEHGYRNRLQEHLHAEMPFRQAQIQAVCDGIPEAEALLSLQENRHALYLLDAMLQLYYMPQIEFIAAPAWNPGKEMHTGRDLFEKRAVLEIAELLTAGTPEILVDISGSTTQMVTALFEKKEQIQAAGSLEQVLELLQPAAKDQARLFLLKAILGLRKIYMQICGLHVYVPYCYAEEKNLQKENELQQLKEASWVPIIQPGMQLKEAEQYFYLLQADQKAKELRKGA